MSDAHARGICIINLPAVHFALKSMWLSLVCWQYGLLVLSRHAETLYTICTCQGHGDTCMYLARVEPEHVSIFIMVVLLLYH